MLGAEGLERRVVGMLAGAVQIERQAQLLDRLGLREPRGVRLRTSHAGVPAHPIADLSFAIVREGQSGSAADPAEGDAQIACQVAAQRQPQCGALNVAAVVVANPVPKRLRARLRAVSWRLFRGDADVEQDAFGGGVAATDVHTGWHFIKVPGVNAGHLGYRGRPLEHILTGIEVRGRQ